MSKQPNLVTIEPAKVFLGLINNKWKVQIIWYLLGGKQRFNELYQRMRPVSQKTLTDNLRDLERDGVITRKAYPEVPPRVEYELTEVGHTMLPVCGAIYDWGVTYIKKQRPGQPFHDCRGNTIEQQ